MFASTDALMPDPSPSESTAITRPSSLILRDKKTSPETRCRVLHRWAQSTSIKLSPVIGVVPVRSRAALAGAASGRRWGRREGINDRIERVLGFCGVFSQQVGD